MTWKSSLAVALLATLVLPGASLAHETDAGPTTKTGTPQLGTPCSATNGQATACDGGYQGNTVRGQNRANEAPDTRGQGMMQGNDFTPGQGIRQTPRTSRGMN